MPPSMLQAGGRGIDFSSEISGLIGGKSRAALLRAGGGECVWGLVGQSADATEVANIIKLLITNTHSARNELCTKPL